MRKKILMMADVKNWAWGIKSRYIQKCLGDEFDIDIVYLDEGDKPNSNYDLYMTFYLNHLESIKNIDFKKKVTGITSIRGSNKFESMKDMSMTNRVVALHANNPELMKKIRKYHHRVFYLPNGVDTALFKPMKKTEENKKLKIGFVGKALPSKGLREFIIPAVKLCQGAELVSLVKEWRKALPFDSMPNFYRNIDVYIVASEDEGTPNPALEAAAMGKPIISNRVGNMPELIKNGTNGFLVNRNVVEYAKKICFLRDHPDILKKMREKMRNIVVNEWDWKIKSENYRKMFRELI